MNDTLNEQADQSIRQNLWWLMILRNLILGGITCVLLLTLYALQYQLPTVPLWTIIASLWIINSISWFRLQKNYPVVEVELFLHLIIDVIGITALLYYTGGAANPVAWFFLVPLIITATILPQDYTWYMVGITSICYTLLILYHIPLPDYYDMAAESTLPAPMVALQHKYIHDLYVLIMWGGYLVVATFVAYFVVEMSRTIKESDHKLALAREQALRNERLIAMGTLAASAAHEMGTPLGTMAILAGELEREYTLDQNPDLHQKMVIMREQVDRCKTAFSAMSESAGELRAVSGRVMNIKAYLDEVTQNWLANRKIVGFHYQASGSEPSPNIIADHTLTHALINVLDNAADVSPKWIHFEASWSAEQVNIEISDRGPGFPKSIVETLGNEPTKSNKLGMGVGLFLTRAIIERLGGSIHLGNATDGGACIQIELPTVHVQQPAVHTSAT
ncbi:MAG TPA: HAMP domain-containing histidine kinase [Crenotrichaceae bacterium]|nr:HAMP domain-containing histidine kinase [Crenotrichaceae bacterium]